MPICHDARRPPHPTDHNEECDHDCDLPALPRNDKRACGRSAQSIVIAGSDGAIDARLFRPDDGTQGATGDRAVIILLPDIRGARPVYEQLALRLTATGHAVLLPNIYYRSAPAPQVEDGAPFDDATRARRQSYRALLTVEA